MSDFINERVDEAQALLKIRAKRLETLLKSVHGKPVSKEFKEGAELLTNMIQGQSEIIDKVVFQTPKTRLEQMRNLQLATGNMNETPAEHLRATTDTMDTMLSTLEAMVR